MELHIVVLMDVFELRKEAMRQLSNEFCHQNLTAEPTSLYKKEIDLLIIMEKTNRWISEDTKHSSFSIGIPLKDHSFISSPNWKHGNYILYL